MTIRTPFFYSPHHNQYTVPTFSFAQGNLHPHVGYLSLHPPGLGTNTTTVDGSSRSELFGSNTLHFTVCPMVNQLRIYLFYVFLLFFTLLVAIALGIRAIRDGGKFDALFSEELELGVLKATRWKGRNCENMMVGLKVLWGVTWFAGSFYVGCCFMWWLLL